MDVKLNPGLCVSVLQRWNEHDQRRPAALYCRPLWSITGKGGVLTWDCRSPLQPEGQYGWFGCSICAGRGGWGSKTGLLLDQISGPSSLVSLGVLLQHHCADAGARGTAVGTTASQAQGLSDSGQSEGARCPPGPLLLLFLFLLPWYP